MLSIASLQLIDTAQREIQVLIMNPTRSGPSRVWTLRKVEIERWERLGSDFFLWSKPLMALAHIFEGITPD